jgi:hypothetical protein
MASCATTAAAIRPAGTVKQRGATPPIALKPYTRPTFWPPMQNGSVESFNARARDEFFNEHVFTTLDQARTAAGDWLADFNDVRPHQSLRYRTPTEYASTFTKTITSQLSAA